MCGEGGLQMRSDLTLDEGVEVLVFDGSLLQADLEGEEEGEEELVLLIEPSTGVAEHTEGQVVDDVLDTLAGDWGLVRSEGEREYHCQRDS